MLPKIRHLSLAHSILELTLEFSRQSPNFPHPVTGTIQLSANLRRSNNRRLVSLANNLPPT
jgi:hypothetical protein